MKIYFTPGPSQLYPKVKNYIEQALKEDILSISHRSRRFEEIFFGIQTGLQKLMGIPNDFHIVFTSSGTECMERALENTTKKYSHHFINGAFSERFYQCSLELKKYPTKTEIEWGSGFYASPKLDKNIETLCLTHNETSTGVAQNMDFIYKLKKENPNMLITLDVVSSAPVVDLDFRYLDCVFFSVQKGFGLPAGLGVMVISPQAFKKSLFLQNKGINIGSYHSFPSLIKYAQKRQTPETPNVLDLYLLEKVIVDMNKVGIEKIRKETKQKAKLLYRYFDKHLGFKTFVKADRDRSQTVIVIHTGGNTTALIEKLATRGLVIGEGYGKFKQSQIRIANFPSHSIENIKLLIETLKHYEF